MVKPRLSQQEMQWRAEDDARTIKRYIEIQGDSERVMRANDILESEQKAINAALVATGVNNIIRGTQNKE